MVGLEPTSLRRATDFKSVVFANFTTPAFFGCKKNPTLSSGVVVCYEDYYFEGDSINAFVSLKT